MPDVPRVSVVIPAYNEERLIIRAIKSIMTQTLQDYEIIIIDDGSTDNTLRVVKEINDRRIRIIMQSRQGIAQALNAGIELASAEYIARLDADDTARSDRLELQAAYLDRHQDIGLLGSFCLIRWEDSKRMVHFGPPTEDASIRKRIIWKNPFIHSSIMMRKSTFLQAGRYNSNYKWEDYELWWRMLSVTKCAILPYELVTRTIRHKSLGSADRIKQFKETEKVLLSVWKRRHMTPVLCLAILRVRLLRVLFHLYDFFLARFPNDEN